MMRVYWAFAKASFQEFLTYRGNMLFELLASLVTPALSITLWYSLFHISGAIQIRGYTRDEMVAYLLCVAFVEGVLHIQNQGMKQMDDIHEGALNSFLLRPFHPYGYWFAHDMARKCMTGILALATIGIVLLMSMFWMHVPLQLVNTLIAILAVVIAAPLHFLLFSSVVLLTFWVGRTWGVTFILRVFMGLATGALIPLSFFPQAVSRVLLFLPFQFFGYVPVQIFLGRFTVAQIVQSFGLLLGWIAVLSFVCAIVYRRGLKSYGAYGG